MPDRDEIRNHMKQAGIEFLLAQFVDIHGSAKVKMVPLASLDDVIDEGAGFAGAAVWGVGQGPHSHDMLARIDLHSYTPLPWMPNTARFAADLYVDGESYPFCPRTNLKRVLESVREKGYVFNVGMEPEHFLVTRNADGSISPWDPGRRRVSGKALLRLPLDGPRHGLPAGTDQFAERTWMGRLPGRPRRRQRPVRSELQLHRCARHRRPHHVLQDGHLADRQEIRRHRHAHAQAVRRPHRQRTPRPLSPRRRRERRMPLRRRRRPPRTRLLRTGLPLRRRRPASRARPLCGDKPHRQLLQAPQAGRRDCIPRAAGSPGLPPSSPMGTTIELR